MAYENAARDYRVTPQHRKAFARKAEWFRMLARLGAKQKEQCARDRFHTGLQILSKAHYLFAWQEHSSTELKR
jgi:hypothetical protein